MKDLPTDKQAILCAVTGRRQRPAFGLRWRGAAAPANENRWSRSPLVWPMRCRGPGAQVPPVGQRLHPSLAAHPLPRLHGATRPVVADVGAAVVQSSRSRRAVAIAFRTADVA